MQFMMSVARKYGLVCLLHEKPFAGRERLRQAQQLVDGHGHGREPARARRQPVGQHQLPVLLRGRDPGGQQAPGAAPGLGGGHRPGPPPGRQRGAAGDHLDLPGRRAREGVRRDRVGRGRPAHPGLVPRASARRCCRRCRCTAATATAPRRSPSPGNKFEFRALGSSMSLAFPNTVLNTIVAEAIDELADDLEGAPGADIAEKVTAVVKDAYLANKQVLFGGDNYSDEWHAEAEQRGLKNLRTTPDALPEVLADAHDRGLREVRGALGARARVALRGLGRAVRDQGEHRGRDHRGDRAHAAAAGRAAPPRADRLGRGARAWRRRCARWPRSWRSAIRALESANGYPDGVEGLELAIYARDNQLVAMVAGARGGRPAREARGRRPLAAAEVQRDPVRALTGHGAGSRVLHTVSEVA